MDPLQEARQCLKIANDLWELPLSGHEITLGRDHREYQILQLHIRALIAAAESIRQDTQRLDLGNEKLEDE